MKAGQWWSGLLIRHLHEHLRIYHSEAGGGLAEELAAGMATSSASGDLKQAVGPERRMVLEWGMSKSLGQMAMGDGRENVFLGYEIAQRRE
jgi:cell division protease FtsH